MLVRRAARPVSRRTQRLTSQQAHRSTLCRQDVANRTSEISAAPLHSVDVARQNRVGRAAQVRGLGLEDTRQQRSTELQSGLCRRVNSRRPFREDRASWRQLQLAPASSNANLPRSLNDDYHRLPVLCLQLDGFTRRHTGQTKAQELQRAFRQLVKARLSRQRIMFSKVVHGVNTTFTASPERIAANPARQSWSSFV